MTKTFVDFRPDLQLATFQNKQKSIFNNSREECGTQFADELYVAYA